MNSDNFVNKFLKNKRYRAVETATSETEMRIKSFVIENAIYCFPLVLSIVGWYFYATFKNQTLPWGQTYSVFQPMGVFWILSGTVLTILAQLFVKPIIKNAFDVREKEMTEDVYQKGAKFCTIDEFNNSMHDYVENEFLLSKDENVCEKFCVQLDKGYLNIPRISLATGLCIIGAPGQGKSVLVNRFLDEIRTSKKSSKQIIVDVKGEFVSKFYDASKDIIICPSDVRSWRFDLVSLLHTQIDTGVLAEILVSDDKTTSDPHWVSSARAIMEAVLVYSSKRNIGNTEIYEIISDPEKLFFMIYEDNEARLIAAQYLYRDENGTPSKETQSILSTLARKAKVLQYLKMLDLQKTEKLNLKEWLENGESGRLFLLSTENLSKVFTPLYGVIVSYVISTLLNFKDTNKNDYFFILDELPRLGKALGENLEKALAVGRSKGIKVVMAMQSYSQLIKEFGKDAGESILDTTNSFFVFKSNISAQFVEKMFGKTTIIRNNESFSMGVENMADRTQIARQMVKESLVDEAEITRLDKFEFYARVEGCKDILKSKFAPIFVKGNGTEPYVENSKMNIEFIVNEMRKVVKTISNRFVDLKKVRHEKKESSTSVVLDF